MRRHRVLVLLAAVGLSLLPLSNASAVPSLQLDIEGGVYDWSTETIVSTSETFNLYALLRPTLVNRTTDWYYISAALVPKTGPDGASLGSFEFAETTVGVTEDMVYGVPPVEADGTASRDPGDLPKHGIFKTFFYEYAFQFDTADKAILYNTQDNPGGFQVASPGDDFLYYVSIPVNVGSLAEGYVIHFDLYNEVVRCSGDYDISAKAPFSHDAESRPVPEPGTLLLLSSGLVGLATFGRKRFKR